MGYRHRTQDGLSPDDIQFIQARDSFYLASLTAEGWPYIQHRGGPRGFLKALGPTRLACADFHGNRQFITMGNLQTDARVSLFFIDYLNHARLKIQGHASLQPVVDVDPALVEQLIVGSAPAERVLTIDVIALDWNCPKYIPTLYPEEVVRNVIGRQLADLQTENDQLRAELGALKKSAD